MTNLSEASPPVPRTETLSRSLVAENTDLWKAMAEHPWPRTFADGTIPEPAFIAWAQQCRLFCFGEGQALNVMLGLRPPLQLRKIFMQLADDTEREPRQLAETLESMGAAVPTNPWPVCMGYLSHVITSSYAGLLEGAVTIYAVEVAYRDTWRSVREHANPDGRWFSWVKNWTDPGFSELVDTLGECVDELAGPVTSPEIRTRLGETFRRVALFEHAFWEMSWKQQGWPALEAKP